jgi:hypothetical protein
MKAVGSKKGSGLISLTIGDMQIRAELEQHAAACEFASLLPLSLAMEDYVGKEKIGFLPQKLSTQGLQSYDGEAVGDLAYYAPWGNIAIFYRPYRFSRGLVRLGRLLDPLDPLLTDQPFTLTIKAELVI